MDKGLKTFVSIVEIVCQLFIFYYIFSQIKNNTAFENCLLNLLTKFEGI